MVHDLLTTSAERDPDSILLIHGARRATYGDVENASNRLSGLLVDTGVQRGDRVCLLLPNSLRYVVSYFAILKAGAICVPLYSHSDARTIQSVLQDSDAVALIASEEASARLAGTSSARSAFRVLVVPDEAAQIGGLPNHVEVVAESAANSYASRAPDGRRGIDLDRCMIVYTSGSTGKARGAVLSHLNLVANTRSIVGYLGLTATDRVSVVLPFPYVYGKSLLNTHVAVGGSLVLHDTLMYPNTVLDTIEAEGATGFAGVPSTFALLLNRSDLAERSLDTLRYVTQAGGAMPTPHLERLIAALPNVKVFVMYGATEAGARLSYLPPEELPRKLGSIGRAIPNVELRVLRDDGTTASTGEIGEIVARGSNIMEGYWSDPDSTAAVLDQNGFHTGDLGWRDEEGFLWISGRKHDLIKSGGHRISPLEIEDVLVQCEGIIEAAVIGKPDEYLGEAIVAYVNVRPDAKLDAERILTFCSDQLPDHKVPSEVIVQAALPRTPSGKIDKTVLRKALSATG